MKKPKLPPPLSLSIQGYGSEGQGVARLPDGMTAFVTGALRGETCLVQLDKVGKTCAWGHVLSVEAPASARLEPDCPYYETCGGCALRHMSYDPGFCYIRGKKYPTLSKQGPISHLRVRHRLLCLPHSPGH